MLYNFAPLLLALSFGLLPSPVVAQTHGVGDLFSFEPGHGACGFTNNSTEVVAWVSAIVYFKFPNATPDPSKNPICNHKITITLGSKTVTAPIVGHCSDNSVKDVGLSGPGFEQFANVTEGIVSNVTWSIN